MITPLLFQKGLFVITTTRPKNRVVYRMPKGTVLFCFCSYQLQLDTRCCFSRQQLQRLKTQGSCWCLYHCDSGTIRAICQDLILVLYHTFRFFAYRYNPTFKNANRQTPEPRWSIRSLFIISLLHVMHDRKDFFQIRSSQPVHGTVQVQPSRLQVL